MSELKPCPCGSTNVTTEDLDSPDLVPWASCSDCTFNADLDTWQDARVEPEWRKQQLEDTCQLDERGQQVLELLREFYADADGPRGMLAAGTSQAGAAGERLYHKLSENKALLEKEKS